MITRVLKAPTTPITDFASLQHHWPLWVSDKEDGIRCITHPTLGPVTQTLKPIRNHHTRTALANAPCFLDGELVTFTNGQQDDFHTVQSKIMSIEGTPDWRFKVFDHFANIYAPYHERFRHAEHVVQRFNLLSVRLLSQSIAFCSEQLEEFEASALARGKEGLMLRRPSGWYKEGRSTFREGYLLKVKRFMDDEALVIGIEEQQQNCNLATRDARGFTQRSKHKANLKPAGRVGALVCKWRGHTIRIDGLNDIQRAMWWHMPDAIIGQTITFRYQPHGTLILPRAPKFKGIRRDHDHDTD